MPPRACNSCLLTIRKPSSDGVSPEKGWASSTSLGKVCQAEISCIWDDTDCRHCLLMYIDFESALKEEPGNASMKAELDALPPLSTKSEEALASPSTSRPEKVCVVVLHPSVAY